jgi:aspartate/methionine/tyrosine aminotransferase
MARFPDNDIITLVGASPRHDLAESTGPDLRLAELLGEAGIGDLALGYGTAAGDGRLRQEIADQHGVGPEDVVVTVGGMHALFLLAFILCERGDEAVTTAPLFPLARNALEAVGARLSILPLAFDRGYRPDLAELRALLSPKTRLVSLASPQNPSGVALPPEMLRAILALMAEICPAAYLLVDETYRDAAYGDDPLAPTAVTLGPRVVSIASLSKCHGAPGLRLGWAITRDPGLRAQLVLGKFNTVISCSTVDEALALRLLAERERIIGARRRHLAEGLRRTEVWVQENAGFVDWVRPNAGAICCVRLKPSVFDAAAVARFQQAQDGAGVRTGRGSWFGEEDRVFRLGFGLLAMPDLEAALAALTAALRSALPVAA